MALGAIGSGILAGGVKTVAGFLGASEAKKAAAAKQKVLDDQTKYNAQQVYADNRQKIALANKMNKEVRARADAAAKTPIVRTIVNTSKTSTANSGGTVSEFGRTDGEMLVRDAEKAGFNPVTYLNAVGGSYAQRKTVTGKSYTTTTSSDNSRETTTGTANMDAALAGQHMPQLSTFQSTDSGAALNPGGGPMQALGDGLVTGVGAFLDANSQEDAQQHEMDMLSTKIRAAQRNPINNGSTSGGLSRSGYVPTATTAGGSKSSGSAGALSGSKKFCTAGGFCWDTDPNVTDASKIEDRYGEPGDWIGGVGVIGADLDRWVKENVGDAYKSNPVQRAGEKTGRYVRETVKNSPIAKAIKKPTYINGKPYKPRIFE